MCTQGNERRPKRDKTRQNRTRKGDKGTKYSRFVVELFISTRSLESRSGTSSQSTFHKEPTRLQKSTVACLIQVYLTCIYNQESLKKAFFLWRKGGIKRGKVIKKERNLLRHMGFQPSPTVAPRIRSILSGAFLP